MSENMTFRQITAFTVDTIMHKKSSTHKKVKYKYLKLKFQTVYYVNIYPVYNGFCSNE